MFKEKPAEKLGKHTVEGRKKIFVKEVAVSSKATFDDVKKFIERKKKKFAEIYPNAHFNIAIKYESISDPKSGGWFPVSGESRLQTPYDYDDDGIEAIYIQYTEN